MTFTYASTIPNPPNDPADDVGIMQTNSASISSIVAVDHVGFNVAGGGLHKQVTFQADVASPSLTGAVGALHVNTVSGVHQLFYKNAVADTQLTGTTISPLASAWVQFNGATLSVGASFGISTVTFAGGNFTINFSTTFPSSYAVLVTNIGGFSIVSITRNTGNCVIQFTSGSRPADVNIVFYHN